MAKTTFTSESVCSGHPDKICDQVSDSIVDAVLEKDNLGRVAVETLVTTNRIIVAGEITTKAKINFEKTIRNEIARLGYTDEKYGFSDKANMEIYIHEQSPEIGAGVKKLGAGDQGMMFGYACKESPELMPLPIAIAHKLAEGIDAARETNTLPYLYPDGKTQVTVEYENGRPVGIEKVVVAVPHSKKIELADVKKDIYKKIVLPILDTFGYKVGIGQLLVNGTGVWHQGGPAADTGVTGRKIIVDTYGGYARVGGGAFSGKDPTKVDRSGAYAARFLAKNIVASGLADRAEVRLAYCIGERKPLMQEVETFGTAKVTNRQIQKFMDKVLDTSVAGILDALDLRNPVYKKTAAYGHFGRPEFAWEKV